jgi:hypothetical protein
MLHNLFDSCGVVPHQVPVMDSLQQGAGLYAGQGRQLLVATVPQPYVSCCECEAADSGFFVGLLCAALPGQLNCTALLSCIPVGSCSSAIHALTLPIKPAECALMLLLREFSSPCLSSRGRTGAKHKTSMKAMSTPLPAIPMSIVYCICFEDSDEQGCAAVQMFAVDLSCWQSLAVSRERKWRFIAEKNSRTGLSLCPVDWGLPAALPPLQLHSNCKMGSVQ